LQSLRDYRKFRKEAKRKTTISHKCG
jgi:hypothetical protein